MKNNKTYMDIGSILDEVFEAAKDFGAKVGKEFGTMTGERPGERSGERPEEGFHKPWNEAGRDENADYYPSYSYPPMNIFLTPERSIVFEFAVAGFDEKNISLSFQGDYMVFSARITLEDSGTEANRYIKRRLKLKDVDKQKYYVPADKFAQEKVKALFRNGILRVTVPPREEPEAAEGIRIEIMKEGI